MDANDLAAGSVVLLARLNRIDALDRRGASPAELLPELRGLIREAERSSRAGDVGEGRGREEVAGRLHTAPHRT
ncbi:MAG: hypothetical protein MSC30_06850 [Gaiellaceae bacterium MAG52_C11]|nr:hypothetical protein [Candidatus Gaiellasilicea maunaloa]